MRNHRKMAICPGMPSSRIFHALKLTKAQMEAWMLARLPHMMAEISALFQRKSCQAERRLSSTMALAGTAYRKASALWAISRVDRITNTSSATNHTRVVDRARMMFLLALRFSAFSDTWFMARSRVPSFSGRAFTSPSSASTVTPNWAAIWISVSTSGMESPRSHLETALSE